MDFLDDTTLQRFWSKVTVQSSGCWEYLDGYIWKSGYPCFWFSGKTWRANRFILWTFKGAPRGIKKHALHTCDNKKCVNPAHLYWGCDADNRRDLMERHPDNLSIGTQFRKGHTPFYGSSKLSETEVAYIKMFLSVQDKRGVTRKHLAECYGVGISTIKQIALGKCWQHIDPYPYTPFNP